MANHQKLSLYICWKVLLSVACSVDIFAKSSCLEILSAALFFGTSDLPCKPHFLADFSFHSDLDLSFGPAEEASNAFLA
jgi:hypothetical protein